MVTIQNIFNFDRAFQNFDIRRYSQEELEFFSLKCSKQLLLAISMFQYSKTGQSKPLGFSSKELGRLSEYSAQLLLGVNLVGGYEAYITALEKFLMEIYEMNVTDSEQTVRKDFKLAIASELRIMNANNMSKSNNYFI